MERSSPRTHPLYTAECDAAVRCLPYRGRRKTHEWKSIPMRSRMALATCRPRSPSSSRPHMRSDRVCSNRDRHVSLHRSRRPPRGLPSPQHVLRSSLQIIPRRPVSCTTAPLRRLRVRDPVDRIRTLWSVSDGVWNVKRRGGKRVFFKNAYIPSKNE